MLGVENLFHPAPFIVWMLAKHVYEVSSGDAKQYRSAVHVNGHELGSPCGERYHGPSPLTT